MAGQDLSSLDSSAGGFVKEGEAGPLSLCTSMPIGVRAPEVGTGGWSKVGCFGGGAQA